MEKEKKEKERMEKERIEKERKRERERIEKEKERESVENIKITEEQLNIGEIYKNKREEEEERKRLEFNAQLLPKIRKDERRAEKLYKAIYGKQNMKKLEEKIEKIKEKKDSKP